MSKMKKILTTICILILFVSISIIDVFAGSVTLSVNGNDTVRVNNNIEITVRASDISGLTEGLATVQGDISFDENYLEYVSFKDVSNPLSVSYGTKTKRFVALGLGGESISQDDNLFTLTFRAKQVGTTTVNISEVVIGDKKAIIHSSNVIPKTINIVSEDTPSVPNNTDNNGNSSDKNPSKPSSSGGGTGSKDDDKTTNKSKDATLSSLVIADAKISPSFNKNTTSYDVIVSEDISKLDIKYTTTNKNAKVSISGNSNLKSGKTNVVIIKVTAEDGTTEEYKLNVKKNDDFSNKLESLEIKEQKVNFDPDNYEYNIKVGIDVEKLTIDAIPQKKDSKVEILGNNKLAKGNNVVLIKLTDKKGFSTYYKVNVKKENTVKLFGVDVKYIIFTLIILLIIILLLLLLFKRKKKDEEEIKVEEKPIKVQLVNDDDEVEDDLYDDIVTKDELISAIEERNPKKLKMLLTQEKANKLKEELKEEEQRENEENE